MERCRNRGHASHLDDHVTLSLISNLSSMDSTDTTFLIATAVNSTGVTPVGAVTFTSGATSLGSVPLVGSGGTATAALAVNGGQLGLGSGPGRP